MTESSALVPVRLPDAVAGCAFRWIVMGPSEDRLP